jgi:hypothetical protein
MSYRNDIDYSQKYLRYKSKYLDLTLQNGGGITLPSKTSPTAPLSLKDAEKKYQNAKNREELAQIELKKATDNFNKNSNSRPKERPAMHAKCAYTRSSLRSAERELTAAQLMLNVAKNTAANKTSSSDVNRSISVKDAEQKLDIAKLAHQKAKDNLEKKKKTFSFFEKNKLASALRDAQKNLDAAKKVLNDAIRAEESGKSMTPSDLSPSPAPTAAASILSVKDAELKVEKAIKKLGAAKMDEEAAHINFKKNGDKNAKDRPAMHAKCAYTASVLRAAQIELENAQVVLNAAISAAKHSMPPQKTTPVSKSLDVPILSVKEAELKVEKAINRLGAAKMDEEAAHINFKKNGDKNAKDRPAMHARCAYTASVLRAAQIELEDAQVLLNAAKSAAKQSMPPQQTTNVSKSSDVPILSVKEAELKVEKAINRFAAAKLDEEAAHINFKKNGDKNVKDKPAMHARCAYTASVLRAAQIELEDAQVLLNVAKSAAKQSMPPQQTTSVSKNPAVPILSVKEAELKVEKAINRVGAANMELEAANINFKKNGDKNVKERPTMHARCAYTASNLRAAQRDLEDAQILLNAAKTAAAQSSHRSPTTAQSITSQQTTIVLHNPTEELDRINGLLRTSENMLVSFRKKPNTSINKRVLELLPKSMDLAMKYRDALKHAIKSTTSLDKAISNAEVMNLKQSLANSMSETENALIQAKQDEKLDTTPKPPVSNLPTKPFDPNWRPDIVPNTREPVSKSQI